MRLEDSVDRWPTFELSPTDYERTVADPVRAAGHEVSDWRVEHLDPVEGVNGTYIIDVTMRFRLLGADYLTLFECKRHASPVKRKDIQVLHDKLRLIGAHKGLWWPPELPPGGPASSPVSGYGPTCSAVPTHVASWYLHTVASVSQARERYTPERQRQAFQP